MNAERATIASPVLAREEAAYRWCRAYARAHNENFTVVSWLLPGRLQRHFFAIYAFCRFTDDLGDEAEGNRLAQLDAWQAALEACYDGERRHPVFVALGRTIETFAIPADPFLRLIEANRMDQYRTGFETYAELLRYCERSATPVGQLVLATLGYGDERRLRLSDAVCIGLQLANFCQDVSVDLAKGRVYIPREDIRAFGYTEGELRSGTVNGAFRALIRFEVERARGLLARGEELERLVDFRTRFDIGLFRLGGDAILDAIEAAGYDVLHRRPVVTRRTKATLMVLQAGRLMRAMAPRAEKGHGDS